MNNEKPVEQHERNLNGLDFFLLWAGAAIALSEIWAGGFLTPLGLVNGLIVILLGHLIGNTPLALAGIIGSRHGVPAIVSTRGALGNRGSYLAAILNIIQLIGWTAVMLWIGGTAAARLAPNITWLDTKTWIIIGGVLTTLWALGGHRYWKWLQRIAVLLLLVLSVILTFIVLRQYGLSNLLAIESKPDLPFMLGLDLVIAMPISWLPLVADYSRYATSTRGSFRGTWWGYFIASSWMYLVGLCAALATQSIEPDKMVLDLMASFGFVGSALVIVLLSTFTTTFLDIYSNSVSILSLFPKLSERWLTVLGGALGTALALLFDPLKYEPFLLFIGAAFCPLFGIVLTDYFLIKKGQYDGSELFRKGKYWYTYGFNIPAIAIWVMGFLAYHYCAKNGSPIGSSLPSMLGSAILYYLFMMKRNER